jgi:hypothetical protein
MTRTFANVVEEVKQLSVDEKQQLQELLRECVIKERRREIRENADASLGEYREGKLQSFTDIDQFLKSLIEQ